MPHPDLFWKTWLAFTPQELARLQFLRWRQANSRLTL
jgi:hypothetical protein